MRIRKANQFSKKKKSKSFSEMKADLPSMAVGETEVSHHV